MRTGVLRSAARKGCDRLRIDLAYQSPYCACGRPLPKGRKKQCYFCLPRRGMRLQPAEDGKMTLEEKVADANSRGLSYGKYQAILHANQPLPPRIHPYVAPLRAGYWKLR